MNKTEMIEHMAKDADLSKASAARALNSFLARVKFQLRKGNSVTILGFGSFTVTKRAARTGRNPRTGEAIKIRATKVPKFKPGKGLKDYTNQR
jgi:DNA-binding protein HU-beta